MTTEQRLIDAFDAARGFEPSPDLWSRVVHSIEEDGRHRRRVWSSVLVVATTVLAAVAVAASSITTTTAGRRLDWRVLEALEAVALLVLIVTLGPAIRRFGRGYTHDLLASPGDTAGALLRLLDVAYYLVFAGYVLLTTRLTAPAAFRLAELGTQVEEAALRVGGLLLLMGVLHAATFMAMPLVGLVIKANRTGRPLPRWVVLLLVAVAIGIALQVPTVLGLLGRLIAG
jgi:hypothetical protein